MIKYALTHEENACCGCGACEQVCRFSAIEMRKNDEGFLYPEVNTERCTQCEACKQACPMENMISEVVPKAFYAVMNGDDEKLIKSSSGGVFRLIADYVISIGGCVVGCILDENMNAVFKITDRKQDLEAMQGSKYLASCPNNVFSEIKEKISSGITVLFTGSPCQNAALFCYLKKQPPNLITIDFLCHGMPSQNAFDSYIDFLENKYHKPIKEYKFRDKEVRGWNLAESFYAGKKKHYNVAMTSTYLYGYTHGYFNRYICYSCPFRGRRITDFTMSDYWGVNKHHLLPNSDKGVSALSINTSKAINIFEEIKRNTNYQTTKREWIAEENPSIMYDHKESIPQIRDEIYSEIKSRGWRVIAHKYLMCPRRFMKKLWYMIPRDMLVIAKKIVRKG